MPEASDTPPAGGPRLPRRELLRQLLKAPAVHQFLMAFLALLIVLALCMVGGLVLCGIEGPQERKRLDRHAELNADMIGYLPAKVYQDLLDLGFWDPAPVPAWDIELSESRWSSFLFAFTIASTIGYGNVTITTTAGKIFVILFSLVSIPATGICLGYLAKRFIMIMDFISQSVSLQAQRTWLKFAKDGMHIPLDILPQALASMGIKNITREKSDKMARQASRTMSQSRTHSHNSATDGQAAGGGEGNVEAVSYSEFLKVVGDASKMQDKDKSVKLRALWLLGVILLWLFLGVLAFHLFELWSWGNSLWFCWISLTTIGFGDFVPGTIDGQIFLIFWATIGLGLVAMLITDISNLFTSKVHFLQELADEDDEPATDADKKAAADGTNAENPDAGADNVAQPAGSGDDAHASL